MPQTPEADPGSEDSPIQGRSDRPGSAPNPRCRVTTATGDFTARCHACRVRTEYRDGQRVDNNCTHVMGQIYTETDLAIERVRAFLNVWKGHPSTSPQVASIYTGPKGEGERLPLLVRDLSLVLEAARHGAEDRPAPPIVAGDDLRERLSDDQ